MSPAPPCFSSEIERLKELEKYRILDTGPEPQFDRIAEMARTRFAVPIAVIAFLDANRNFLKARGDLRISESPRAVSFCRYTIQNDDVLVVLDASEDERFSENPLVTGNFHIRFYAGAPLTTPAGYRIGTLCIFDTEARADFKEADRQALRDLASIVADHLEMRLLVGNVHDEIVTRRAAEAESNRLAYHDALTGLQNWASLQNVLANGLPFDPQGMIASMAIDIDELKAVNETLGHRIGDELLMQTARIIKAAVGDRAIVARIGGDEFVALVGGTNAASLKTIAEEIADRASQSLSIAGHTISQTVSIGLAFAEADQTELTITLSEAEFALRAAKQAGRGGLAIFDEKMAVQTRRRDALARDLVVAMQAKSIEVHFQPIHQAPDGPMIGVEALARWHHPEMGWISPVEFIPIAEESGQILELGEHVLRTALNHFKDHQFFISVNLSPVQFRLVDTAATVAAILAETGFPPTRLQLKITEGVLLHDLAAAQRQISALKNIGVGVALDDFGTGFASLSYLSALPFDKLKIDRSFVQGAWKDRKRRAIIAHIVALARELDMRVTAEGVETKEDAILLTAAGCTSLQGFYFGRPVPAQQLDGTLAQIRRSA